MQYPFLRTSFFVGWSTPFAKTMFWLKGEIFMKINYLFNNGEKSSVEVSIEIGEAITDSRRKEDNLDRKERYHCYSLDALEYGDKDEFSPTDGITPETEMMKKIENQRIHNALMQLTETQRRRLLMLAEGYSLREIAKKEKTSFQAIDESIKSAKKNFLKNFS